MIAMSDKAIEWMDDVAKFHYFSKSFSRMVLHRLTEHKKNFGFRAFTGSLAL